MSLEHRVALVTGATRGIGKAIALALGRRGATVVGTATTSSGAQAITAMLEGLDLRGQGVCLDVTNAGAVDDVVKTMQREHGAITILVNNAGITRDNLLMRMKDDEWDTIIDTNLKSVYRLSRAVLRGMLKERHGRIINVGSVVGSTGNPGQCNYAAAKAGVGGFARSLAREVGSRGVTVNVVAPGFVETDMTDALTEAQRAALLQQIPLARLGHVDDVAAAVCFLASDDAAYVTGATLHVNGGMYMD